MRAAAWQARPGPAPASGGLARGGVTPTPARPCEGTGEEGAGPAGQADRGHARRGVRALRSNALVPAPPPACLPSSPAAPTARGARKEGAGRARRRRARQARSSPWPRFTQFEGRRLCAIYGPRSAAPGPAGGSGRAPFWELRKGWRPKVLWGGSLCAGGGPGRGGRAAPGPETGDRSESPRGGGKVTAAESSRLSSSVIVAGFRAVP